MDKRLSSHYVWVVTSVVSKPVFLGEIETIHEVIGHILKHGFGHVLKHDFHEYDSGVVDYKVDSRNIGSESGVIMVNGYEVTIQSLHEYLKPKVVYNPNESFVQQIKNCRNQFGVSLKEARDTVDKARNEWMKPIISDHDLQGFQVLHNYDDNHGYNWNAFIHSDDSRRDNELGYRYNPLRGESFDRLLQEIRVYVEDHAA